MIHCATRTRRRDRRGLSLLEVLLSLTILAVSLAILGELVSMGTRSAASARDLTRAQLLCENKLAELTSGALPVVSQYQVEYETDPEWLYSVDVQDMGTGLLAVTVTLQRNVVPGRRAETFSLTRWIPDPEIEWPEAFPEVELLAEAAATDEATGEGGASSGGGGTGQGGR